jgi:hypothetical protein
VKRFEAEEVVILLYRLYLQYIFHHLILLIFTAKITHFSSPAPSSNSNQ